jgi:hypothetical protein
MRKTCLLLIPALAAAFLAGCGGDGRRPVHPAKGRLTYQGRPTPFAQVTLHPLDPADKDAPHPTGKVNDDGTFVLTTYTGQDGAPVGEYGVSVQWWLSPARKGTREGDSPLAVNRLPARYGRPETSGLKVRIQPGENRLPPIDLKR